VLTLAIALNPQSLEVLCKEKWWHNFIVDLVLMSEEKEIRSTAAEQFLLIATRYIFLLELSSK
jgi:ubiquitin carboxyl-terminal hydrolase 9/24